MERNVPVSVPLSTSHGGEWQAGGRGMNRGRKREERKANIYLGIDALTKTLSPTLLTVLAQGGQRHGLLEVEYQNVSGFTHSLLMAPSFAAPPSTISSPASCASTASGASNSNKNNGNIMNDVKKNPVRTDLHISTICN